MSKATKSEETVEPEPEEQKVKECFIITPLGANGSDIRRKADGLINVVLQPILQELGFTVIPPHKMLTSGSITIQIIEKLLNADLVVCNLTGLNPNVMYELAVRHASRKPIVCLYESGPVALPFDIAAERTIFYSDDIAGVEALKPVFKEYVQAAIDDPKPDNPIYRVATQDLIKIEMGSVNAESLILDRLNELTSQVSRMNVDTKVRYTSPNRRSNFIDFIIEIKAQEPIASFEIAKELDILRGSSIELVTIKQINSQAIRLQGRGFQEKDVEEYFKALKSINPAWVLSLSTTSFT